MEANRICDHYGCTIDHRDQPEYWQRVWQLAVPVIVGRERKVCRNSLMERVEKDNGKDR